MNGKTKVLCALALILACSPVFAEDSAAGTGSSQKTKVETAAGSPAKKEAAEKKTVKTKTAKATVRKVAKDEVGKEAVCPVTGEKFTVTAKTGSASYKGKIYYFCCPGCKKPFLENPEKFLNKKQAAQGKIYVCPMGDYQGDKPGKCPKCGMDLVEKK